MKKIKQRPSTIIPLVLGALMLAGVNAATTDCTPGARQAVVAAIDAGLAACVAANADLQDADLQKACGFAEDLWPLVRRVVEGSRKGAAKFGCKPAAQPPDAGR